MTKFMFVVRDSHEDDGAVEDLAMFFEKSDAVVMSLGLNASVTCPRFVVDRRHFVGGRVV